MPIVVAMTALWLVAGCGRYTVTLRAGSQINAYEVSDPESGGRLLQVTVVCMSGRHFKRLARSQGFRRQLDPEDEDAWTWITAEKWYTGGLDQTVRRIVTEEDAIETVNLRANQTVEAKVRHPGGGLFDKRKGILVLADFSGVDEENKHLFESAIWTRTRFPIFGGRRTVEVGPTTINWAK